MVFETLMVVATLYGAGAPRMHDHAEAHVRRDPLIEVWTNRDDVLSTGQPVRVYFRTGANAYVMVFRVDTDGQIEVLFPHRPWENNYVRRDRRYEIRPYGDQPAFVVRDDPGEGYLFAIASREPFNYSEYVTRDRWDHRYIGYDGRIVGDPYVALMDIIDVVLPRTYTEYDYDVLPYYVERYYEYPRFLCYDCHAYTGYHAWDPYDYTCVRFGIVAYRSPYYYPARVQRANRVVFVTPRPRRLEPRYVFTERHPAEPYVIWMDQRPENDRGERRLLRRRGATGRDFGGVGRVPTPTRDRGIDRDSDRRRNRGMELDRPDLSRRRQSEGEPRRVPADAVVTPPDPRSTPRRLTNADRRKPNEVRDRGPIEGELPSLKRRNRPERAPRTGDTLTVQPAPRRSPNDADTRSRRPGPDTTAGRDDRPRRSSERPSADATDRSRERPVRDRPARRSETVVPRDTSSTRGRRRKS